MKARVLARWVVLIGVSASVGVSHGCAHFAVGGHARAPSDHAPA